MQKVNIYKYNVSQTNIKGVKHYSFSIKHLSDYTKVYKNDNYDTDNLQTIRELADDLEALGIKFNPDVKNDLSLKIFGMYVTVMFKYHLFCKNKYHSVPSIMLAIKHELNMKSYFQLPIIEIHREILRELLMYKEIKNI